MAVKNRIADMLPEITAWRHDFHEHPELLFEVHRTAARVAALCRSFGCDGGGGRTGGRAGRGISRDWGWTSGIWQGLAGGVGGGFRLGKARFSLAGEILAGRDATKFFSSATSHA